MNRERFLAEVQEDPFSVSTWPYLQNEEIALAAVTRDGRAYRSLRRNLQMLPSVVFAAVRQNGLTLGSMVDNMYYDVKPVVLAAVQQNGIALRSASFDMKADKEVVMAAVQQNGKAIQFASPEMRADPSILMCASLHGYAPTPQQIAIVIPYMNEVLSTPIPEPLQQVPQDRDVRQRMTVYPLQKLNYHGPHFKKQFEKIINSFAKPDYEDAEQFKKIYVDTTPGIRNAADALSACVEPGCNVMGGKKRQRHTLRRRSRHSRRSRSRRSLL
jgi:hypothetical protein